MSKHKAFIALGSNLAGTLYTPASQVLRGFAAISQISNTQVLKQSSLYKTPPVGYANQPDFINAVAQIQTALSPQQLLTHLQTIEHEAGRERTFANAPRVLDLDILLFDDLRQNTPTLTLPHPRMFERAFVLVPLAEIAPDLLHPDGRNIVELLNTVSSANITKL